MLISSFRSGNFEISIYNSLEKKVVDKWEEIKSESLNSAYLCFIEDSKPKDLKFRYVIIEEQIDNKTQICAIIYFQLLKFTKKNIHFRNSFFLSSLVRIILTFHPFHFLICGNIFAVNFPAINFKKDKIERGELLNILSQIQKIEKSEVFIIKDLDNEFTKLCKVRTDWVPYPFDLTMVLSIDPLWHSMIDYKHSLTKKYKRRSEKIIESGNKMTRKELNAEAIKAESQQIKILFNQVASKQTVKMGLIGDNYFYEFKKRFPNDFSFIGYYYEKKLVAFASYIEHGKVLEIHYIGINYYFNKSLMIYFNILYDGVEMAIINKKEQLELGRTAREAKANIGAKPVYFNDFISVNGGFAKKLSNRFINYFQSEIGEKWTEKHPFRK